MLPKSCQEWLTGNSKYIVHFVCKRGEEEVLAILMLKKSTAALNKSADKYY